MSMYGLNKGLPKGKRARPVVSDFSGSRTQQHRRNEFDVNTLVAKFGANRLASALAQQPSRFADISMLTDYKSCLDSVNRANESFMDLPSALRSRFLNDPANLIAFLNDESNRDEAISLGLITAPVTDEAKRKDVKLPKDPPDSPPK